MDARGNGQGPGKAWRGAAPGSLRALLRAAAKRCPRCGQDHLFSRWFRFPARCPRCGLAFERLEGAFLGSMTISYGATAIAFVLLLVVWLAVDLPDVQVGRLTAAAAAVVIAVPLVVYPFSKMLWAAFDYLAHRAEAAADAARAEDPGQR